MKYPKLYCSVIAMLSIMQLHAYDKVKDAFINAPFDVLPTLSKIVRLDMIDYYESGLERPSLSNFDDNVMMISMSDDQLEVQTSKDCKIAFYNVPYGKDTAILVIETFAIPFPDSRVTLYSNEWTKLSDLDSGLIAGWINDAGIKSDKQKDIENLFGFAVAEASFDLKTQTLTFTNTLQNLTTKDSFDELSPFLKNVRQYTLTSKGFKEL